MDAMENQGILLESGTNEVEIAIFTIGKQLFGTNVAKIREFIIYDEEMVTTIVNQHPSVIGTFLLRGHTIPLMDLRLHLNKINEDSNKDRVIIVTEFNNLVNGFLVDNVDRIIRVSWTDFEPMSTYFQNSAQKVTGSVRFDNQDILILDMEQIISEIFPEQMEKLTEVVTVKEGEQDLAAQRRKRKILIAEDSALVRSLIIQSLTGAGYQIAVAFENGKDALDHIQALLADTRKKGTDFADSVNLVITDIEMPQMDGLTLCRKIKEDLKLTHLPVVIFSSLISEQMALKCESVGANGYITKPEIGNLVKLVDSLAL